MDTITRKSDLKLILENCSDLYQSEGLDSLVDGVFQQVLSLKVKFPLLEYAASEFFELIPEDEHLVFCDAIESLNTIGGNVILGIILQKRLKKHFEESFQKAAQYISNSEEWYVSDLIGERVFGYGLLTDSEKALPLIRSYAFHENNMVQRSTGAGMHYAIKKGLKKEFAKPVFELLLSKASIRDYQAKRGIGWAAKTMSKFHPDLVNQYSDQITAKATGQWFRTKVNIGLARYKHAQGN